MVGRVLDDRYRIGPKIARGGMATVYQATDLKLERTVAVKIMRSEFTEDESFVKRFKREARSAAQLSHPNVVSVFDTGDDHGTLYLVMEYVPGQTLRSVIRKEAPMSPIRALTLIEQVLQALRAAHRAGLLHRDVKPENALLLKRLLETVGFPVQIANNGVRGVELFADWRPDFIWMDWRMPVLDGVEATRRIRAAEGGSAVKIAAITASVLPEQQEAILAVGVDDIVRKPYAFRTIFDCLARHLGVRYVYRERAAAPDPAEGRALAPAALSELPEDVRRELADALVALDCARIDEMIGRVSERDAELARALRRHADAFDYDPIMKALAPAGTTNEAA